MVPSSITANLAALANIEINRVLRSGAPLVGQKQPTGEVGFVAAFVLGAVPAIATAWRPLLKPIGLTLKMSGIFCHQTPMVRFFDQAGVKRRCELADLLIVVDDLRAGAMTKRRAVLVQAKMASAKGGKTISGQGDKNQLDLLSNWPNFTLPNNFSPGQRDFANCMHSGSIHDCGRFGLIDKQPRPLWHQQAAAQVMPAGGDELGTFIAKMVEGSAEYGRDATGVNDDWSRTVDELLKVTAGLAFKYSIGLKGKNLRGNSSVALVIAGENDHYASEVWKASPPPTGGKPDQLGEEPPSEGINLVHIGISKSENAE